MLFPESFFVFYFFCLVHYYPNFIFLSDLIIADLIISFYFHFNFRLESGQLALPSKHALSQHMSFTAASVRAELETVSSSCVVVFCFSRDLQ